MIFLGGFHVPRLGRIKGGDNDVAEEFIDQVRERNDILGIRLLDGEESGCISA